MPSAFDLEMTADFWYESIYRDRVPRARTQVVERDAHLPPCRDRRRLRPHQLCELPQDAQHLTLLRRFRRAQLIAELDDLGRLDKDGAARRRFVVHDAAHARARGATNRNHVAATPHRYRRVGRALGLVQTSEDR